MASFEGVMRTNYFHVKDADAFFRFIDEVETDVGKLQLLKKGNVADDLFGFGCYGEILGVKNPETDGADYDAFLSQLQEHVVDGECIILIQIGHEKLNYVVGRATVITPETIVTEDISSTALVKARATLHNPEYNTELDY